MVMGCDKLSRDNLSHVQSDIFMVRSSLRNKIGFALTHVEPLWRRSARGSLRKHMEEAEQQGQAGRASPQGIESDRTGMGTRRRRILNPNGLDSDSIVPRR